MLYYAFEAEIDRQYHHLITDELIHYLPHGNKLIPWKGLPLSKALKMHAAGISPSP